jgi:hypothetical protein
MGFLRKIIGVVRKGHEEETTLQGEVNDFTTSFVEPVTSATTIIPSEPTSSPTRSTTIRATNNRKGDQTRPTNNKNEKSRVVKDKSRSANQLPSQREKERYLSEVEKVRERNRRRQIRREIRERLTGLTAKGEECETELIIEFISHFRQITDLVREELSLFDGIESYPILMIQKYLSSDLQEELDQQIEEYKLSRQIAQYSDWLNSNLPDPVLISVETTELGPELQAITPEAIYAKIKEKLGEVAYDIMIEGEIPFSRIGDYEIHLDLSPKYRLTRTVQLTVEDRLPPDCINELKQVMLLPIPETSNVLESLQDYHSRMLAAVDTITSANAMDYISHLGAILVTAYHFGYGKSPFVQDMLRDWRSKRDDYALILGLREIRETIQHNNTIVIPKEDETEDFSKEDILKNARDFIVKNATLSRYEFDLHFEGDSTQAILPVEIQWRGIPVGEIYLQRSTSLLSQKSVKSDTDLPQLLDQSLNKVLPGQDPASRSTLMSDISQEFYSFARLIKRDLLNTEISKVDKVPSTFVSWLNEAKNYYGKQYNARAEHFLQLARVYAERDNENLLRCSLAEYCYAKGNQYFHQVKRDARPYLQIFLFLYGNMLSQEQHSSVWECYWTLALYFDTYGFSVDIGHARATEIESKFYTDFLNILSSVSRQRQFEQLGNCIVRIGIANSSLIIKLIDNMKEHRDTRNLNIIADALQETHVLHADLFLCLQLLAHIDINKLANTMTRVSLTNAEERRHTVVAVLKLAALSPDLNFSSFTSQVSDETKATLAFSLLVEPFIFDASKTELESKMKARLIAQALRLPSENITMTYFLERIAELSLLFDRFFGSLDPNMKGNFAFTILNTIRSARRRLIENLPNDRGDLVLQLLRRTEAYITAEQNKLIRDTRLEIVLVSDRALYSIENTRIIIEIRNAGEGIADNLELKVIPVEDKYDVDERKREYKIDSLADKTPVQIEIFIQPLVGFREKVDLDIVLQYDTLKLKGKTAQLKEDNRSVWFYSESQFMKIPQPYSIGQPATTWFYGRQELLENMADDLHPGKEHDASTIVYGLKRAGKTSVVKRFIEHTLEERGLNESHIPIYIDLQLDPRTKSIKNDGDFLYLLMEALVKNLSLREPNLSLSFTKPADSHPHQAFESFTNLLEEIGRAIGDRHLLVVLDEFSILYGRTGLAGEQGMLTPEVFGFLSNTIQSTYQLTFILIGTYILHEMMRDHLSDLAKICIPRMISFLDAYSARELVQKPVLRRADSDKGWLEYDPRAVDHIVTSTHSHPYLIQYICRLLVEKMNSLKYNFVNVNDVKAILDDIINKPAHERTMLTFWDEFDPSQRKVLSIIATEAQEIQAAVDIETLSRTFAKLGEPRSIENILQVCSSLKDAQILEKFTIDTDDFYRISIPLYQKWLKEHKPVKTVFGRISD